MIRILRACAVVWVLAFTSTSIFAANNYERELSEITPQIIQLLRQKGIENVGVLKFRVRKAGSSSETLGTLDRRLSEKLELALIVKNDARRPIGVIHNANAVAAKIPGASHLSSDGRQKLFSVAYPLAWGNQRVVPDAFLTGVAVVSTDLKSITLGILLVEQNSDQLQPVAKIEYQPDLENLVDMGTSFNVRGVFDGGHLKKSENEREDLAISEVVSKKIPTDSEPISSESSESTPSGSPASSSQTHPLSPDNKESPIALQVFYDNQLQPIEFREGEAFLPEPSERQQVHLVVRRKGSLAPRLGMVLKVNGENTLMRQTLPDARCRVWVLEPDRDAWGIRGYYDSERGTMQPFEVLSSSESQAKEIDYGEFVGALSVTLFPEQKAQPKLDSPNLINDAEDFQILANADFPKESADSLPKLRALLASAIPRPRFGKTRGLIVDSSEEREELLDEKKFKRDSIPVMSATINYYAPQDLPE